MKRKTTAFALGLAFFAGALAAAAGSAAGGWFPWGRATPVPEGSAAVPTPPAIAAPPAPSRLGALPSFADVAAAAQPAVVNISTTQTMKNQPTEMPFFGAPPGKGDPFEDFFRRFAPQMPQRNFKQRSLGSGFVIDPAGTIVTNYHVVANADDVTVKLSSSDHEYKARVVGGDPKTDIAVLKIEPKEKLPSVRLGSSKELRVGDWVIAIGNPFGLSETVTAGIVSAKGRVIGQGPYDDFIQTDASINPGNSGGPLLDAGGEVVGINSAIFSETGGNVGIGFAIPSDLARGVVEQLQKSGKVVRGWLGIAVQDVNEELAQSFHLDKPSGSLVADVTAGGPAARAGIERGDVIVEYEGKPLTSSHELPALVAATPVGKSVDVKILRAGAEKTVSVKVGEQPGGAEEKGEVAESSGEKLGLMVAPLTPDVAGELGVPPDSGVLVKGVESGSVAETAGLRAGDVVVEVSRKPVKSVDEFKRAVGEVKAGQSVLLLVKRGEAAVFLALRKPT